MRRMAGTTFVALCAFLGWMPAARATTKPDPKQCNLLMAPTTSEQWATRVPANAPALVVQPSTMYESGFQVAGASLQANGAAPVPLEQRSDDRLIDAVFFVPKTPLVERTEYALSLDIACPSADPGFETAKTRTRFVAWDSVPLPTSTGTATAELAVKPDGYSSVASLIHLTPSPELRAYLATTMFELSTDGKKFAVTTYGERYWAGASIDATVDIAVMGKSTWTQRTNLAACGDTDTSIVTKTVTVQPHVAGATTDPTPVDVQVPFDCRPPQAPPEPASGSSNDESSTSASHGDAGGCGVAGARGDHALTFASFAAACMALALGRRRARRAPAR